MPRSRVAASTGPISNVKFTETAPPSERTQVSRVRFYVLRAPQVGVDSGNVHHKDPLAARGIADALLGAELLADYVLRGRAAVSWSQSAASAWVRRGAVSGSSRMSNQPSPGQMSRRLHPRLWIGWFGQVPPMADESGENSAWLWLTIKDSRLAHRCDLRVPLRELHRRLSPPSQRNPTGFGCGYRHARRSSARSSSRR